MNVYEVKDHEPSLLPEGKEFRLIWQDEFDGTELDTAKWDYRLSMMGKRHPAWTDKGVQLDGQSNAVFILMKDENGNPVSSQLQTGYNFMDEPVVPGNGPLQWNIGKLRENKFTHAYGYYECRCRLQKKAGWWSAFWIQSPIIGASLDCAETGTEIDIMENFKPGEIVPHYAITGGYGPDRRAAGAGGRLTLDVEEYHRFGLLWDETGYIFYVDGVEDGHIDQYLSKRPEFILISTEVNGYRAQACAATDEACAAVGDTFLVDYVRVFDAM